MADRGRRGGPGGRAAAVVGCDRSGPLVPCRRPRRDRQQRDHRPPLRPGTIPGCLPRRPIRPCRARPSPGGRPDEHAPSFTCCGTARCRTRRTSSTAGCPATGWPPPGGRWPPVSPTTWPAPTSPTSPRRRCSGRRRPRPRWPRTFGLHDRHRRPGHRGRQRLRGPLVRAERPTPWDDRGPGSSSAIRARRPGVSRTWTSRTGCWRRSTPRCRPQTGTQAVLVSHQLPIVTARRYLHGQRLWHDPRRRQCSVASLDLADLHRRRLHRLRATPNRWRTSPR